MYWLWKVTEIIVSCGCVLKTYRFLLFLRQVLVAWWVVVCLPHFRCWFEGIPRCEHGTTVKTSHMTNCNYCLEYCKMCLSLPGFHDYLNVDSWSQDLGPGICLVRAEHFETKFKLLLLLRHNHVFSLSFRVYLPCPQNKVTMVPYAKRPKLSIK